ncbi:hypothetical protein D3C75_1155820 [compost metagenome]
MRGFGRGALDDHVQAFFFAAGVLELHGLLAIVVDGQVAHDLEQVTQLGLERGGDLRRGAEPKKSVLHHIFSAGATASDARGDLHQNAAVVDKRLE